MFLIFLAHTAKIELSIKLITEDTMKIFYNLSQAYEAEFSNLTGKLPDKDGFFYPDTLPEEPYAGYFIYQQDIPIGFSILHITQDVNTVKEFYISGSSRKKNIGQWFAKNLFDMHKGIWHVQQLILATAATQFWRSIITKYTNNSYKEEQIVDSVLGKIVQQSFNNQ